MNGSSFGLGDPYMQYESSQLIHSEFENTLAACTVLILGDVEHWICSRVSD